MFISWTARPSSQPLCVRENGTLCATVVLNSSVLISALLDVLDPSWPLWRRQVRHRMSVVIFYFSLFIMFGTNKVGSGESAITSDGRYFAITNLASAVQVYEIVPTGLRISHTFSSPSADSSNYPLQICFAECESLIVSGSDSGELRAWELATGKKFVLSHGEQRMILLLRDPTVFSCILF